jgi:hypothetical protein
VDTLKKEYAVFTWKLANALYRLGFRPIGTRLNYKDPTQQVILFEDTAELREAIRTLTKKG